MMGEAAADCSLVAFGPHPDDVEIFCGGLLAKASEQGHRTAIVDMTRGELASQGSVEEREEESRKAAELLGVAHRRNLGLPDGTLDVGELDRTGADGSALQKIVAVIRELRPAVVAVPYWHGRHPDHSGASRLLSRALFFAGLRKFAPTLGPAHVVSQTLFYQMRHAFRPSFVSDISAAQARKAAAIACYSSQLQRSSGADGPPTLISSPLSLRSIEARDRYYGAMIGVEFGEPFLINNAVAIDDPVSHFRAHPGTGALIFPEVL